MIQNKNQHHFTHRSLLTWRWLALLSGTILLLLIGGCTPPADAVLVSPTTTLLASNAPRTATATLSTSTTPTVTSTPIATTLTTPTPTNAPPTPTPTYTPAPLPTTTPVFALGDTRTREKDGMVMVYVPAGEFQMGTDEGEYYERPVHTVALDAFWLDRTEVDVAQFRQFVNATGYTTAAEKRGYSNVLVDTFYQEVEGANWAHPAGAHTQADDNHPVVHISWDDAAAYCAWVGGQLPTEAEWEYAARGPNGLLYPWGNTFDGTRLNFCDAACGLAWADTSVNDGYEFTAPVGSYPAGASWIGALDLAGNVGEWIRDWYGDAYPSEKQVNPTGPSTGVVRGLRGGMWYFIERHARGTARSWNGPAESADHTGFRCSVAWSPQE